MSSAPVLAVRNLTVAFDTRQGAFDAVEGVSFDVQPGQVLGVVGESGSGKSVTAMALMRLLPDAARIGAGTVDFGGRDLLTLSERAMRGVRGREIAMVFQDPMTLAQPDPDRRPPAARAAGACSSDWTAAAQQSAGGGAAGAGAASRRRRSSCAPTRTSSRAACGSG